MPKCPGKSGRPLLEPTRRKTFRLTIYLASRQRRALERQAAAARLPLSAYVRRVALAYPGQPLLSPPDVFLFAELSRLGNNLNQLTKLAHERHPLAAAHLPVLEDLRQLLLGLRRSVLNLDSDS